ncbi:MAG: nucleotidyltransferase family protein [Pseudomonadota bacterium]
MIFAAGLGTRMGALTKTCPKPLLQVAGKSLLDRALDLGKEAAVARTVVNAHYLHERITAHLEGRDVIVSVEMPALLDTGGGLRQALPFFETSPVFTLNPDAVWTGPNPLIALARAWKPDKMDALMMLIPPEAAHARAGRGDVELDAQGRVRRGGALIYGGAQLVKTENLRDIRQTRFSLNILWDRMIVKERLFGTIYAGGWCDVGHPEGITRAEAMLHGTADV